MLMFKSKAVQIRGDVISVLVFLSARIEHICARTAVSASRHMTISSRLILDIPLRELNSHCEKPVRDAARRGSVQGRPPTEAARPE